MGINLILYILIKRNIQEAPILFFKLVKVSYVDYRTTRTLKKYEKFFGIYYQPFSLLSTALARSSALAFAAEIASSLLVLDDSKVGCW